MNKELTEAQRQAIAAAPAYRRLMEEIGDTLWNRPEVGLQEYHSAAYLTQIYREHGFRVTGGVAGFPTGFVAEYRNGGGPVLAILCEYDALPALSATTPGANGHGCGHCLYSAAATATALLLREIIEANGVQGTLRVYGTPGEENYAGKAYYVHQGLFDDVDCSVGFHPHDANRVNYTVSAGTLFKSYTFHGKPAHAGNEPWAGISALDAAEIMNVAANYLREHVRTDVRIQYIITKGGAAANIVPELAASEYMIRSASVPYMEEVARRVDNCAHAAALATGCTVEIRQLDKTYNTVLLREYAQLAQHYLELAGPPAFSPQELADAKKFGDGSGLSASITPLPAQEGYHGGATDEGDVSWVIPHVSIYVANVAHGTAFHTLPATCQMNLSPAYTAMITQVQATSAMLLELFQSPRRVEELKAAHKAKMGGLVYPKNPSYILDPRFNPNCQGVTVRGDTLSADLDQVILLPRGGQGRLEFVLRGEPVAALSASGSVQADRPLAPGDSLFLFWVSGEERQLVGYYNV